MNSAYLDAQNNIVVLDAETALRGTNRRGLNISSDIKVLQAQMQGLQNDNIRLLRENSELRSELAQSQLDKTPVEDQARVQELQEEIQRLKDKLQAMESELAKAQGTSSFKSVSLSALMNEEKAKAKSANKIAFLKKFVDETKKLKEDQ